LSHENSSTAARLTSLYEAHAPDTFRYALHLTGRREDAEDVVQYVFLQAYAALEAGRDLVNPRAWLIKATKHRSLNLIRDRRDTPAAEVHAPGRPAAGAAEAEALADVRASLWSLPEPQHHAFVLRHWSGLSQDEIADVLATTPGAVESLLVRARATLVAEREAGDRDCAGVRDRLVRMLAPTPAHEAHLADCRRCRTAQARLLRASGFAAALVPGPQVAHALAAAVPGFGASGAAAGTAAAGAGAGGAGAGTGGAAVSTASLATKAGLAAKIAVAATTAAVAVTAAHPVRTAVTHAFLGAPKVRAAAGGAHARAAHAASTHTATGSKAGHTGNAGGSANGPTGAKGAGHGKGNGNGKGQGTPAGGGSGAGKGKSGTAGSNGNGNGQGGAPAGKGAANGKSASAPGKTKAPGSKPASGQGQGQGNGSGNGKGNGTAGSTGASGTTSNGSGNAGGGTSNAGGNGAGGSGSNAGGNGKGNGNP
jgi:RNA polymerase sigma factor (sigma-70 family)